MHVRSWNGLVWAIPLLAVSWALTFLVDPWADDSVTDFHVLRGFAETMTGGDLPYRDFAFEYPPLAAPLIALPGVAGTSEDAYTAAFGVLMFAAALGAMLLVRQLARRTGGNEGLALAGMALAPLLLGATARTHFDLVPLLLCVGALAAITAHRPALGFGLLGIGGLVKVFPLAMVPIAIAWLWARGQRNEAKRGLLALIAVLAVGVIGWIAFAADGAMDALRYQAERPVQVESTPAALLYALSDPDPIASHRSNGLADGDVVAGIVGGIGFAVIALLAFAAARGRDDRALVLAALGAIAAYAAFGKVLSPQFLVWTFPLLALALAWRMWLLAATVAAATVLTFAEFPFRYFDVVAMEPGALWLVGVRDALLVAAVLMAAAGAAARSRTPGHPRLTRSALR